jgi:hypothetical protein
MYQLAYELDLETFDEFFREMGNVYERVMAIPASLGDHLQN